MRKTRVVRPDYEQRFRCIGPLCEDTCCEGWQVNVDPSTYRKYKALPASPLRARLDEYIVPVDQIVPSASPMDTARPVPFHSGSESSPACSLTALPASVAELQAPVSANIRLLPAARCPFLAESRLCQIQSELGESYLSDTCSTFPRRSYTIDKIEEKTLSLSCPEAARLVLLAPRFTTDESTYHITWEDSPTARLPLRSFFWPIREFAIHLIRDRKYPLWQRMFLLGVFASRLDALARGKLDRDFAILLDDFARAVQTGTLRVSMETIPANPSLQLEMVLRLVKLGIRPAFRGQRFNECLRAFALGVGHQPGVPLESQAANYSRAFREVYEPFFARHPEILENYLANQLFRDLFPFGNALMNPSAQPEPAKAFAHLATQFALINGLLIGSAGFHRDSFSLAHVVQIVQTAYKHFEHCPEFLVEAQSTLAGLGLQNIPGLTALVRN